MKDLLSTDRIVKLVSTTKYEVALIEDNYGYFVAYSHNNGHTIFGKSLRDYNLVSGVFEEILQQLEGN